MVGIRLSLIGLEDKNTILSITESLYSIEVEIENDNKYNLELQAYKRLESGKDGQIAFQILNENNIKPYFLDANNKKIGNHSAPSQTRHIIFTI